PLRLRIPKLRQGSYFPPFLEPRKTAEKALITVIQELEHAQRSQAVRGSIGQRRNGLLLTRRWRKEDSNPWPHLGRRRFSEYVISPPRAARQPKADPLRPEGRPTLQSPFLQR